jgi:hypothetical protein
MPADEVKQERQALRRIPMLRALDAFSTASHDDNASIAVAVKNLPKASQGWLLRD